MRNIAMGLMMLGALIPSDGAVADSGNYGEPVTGQEVVGLSKLLASYSDYRDRDVVLEGRVEKVCRKKGCWMVLQEGEREIRVTFKDYGFFVPAELEGTTIRARGRVIEKVVPVSELRHYLEDEGRPEEEIRAVKEPRRTYRFVAAGVQRKG